ncbi:unnamed protein product [Sphagnum balticum]
MEIFKADVPNAIFENIKNILESSLSTLRFYYFYDQEKKYLEKGDGDWSSEDEDGELEWQGDGGEAGEAAEMLRRLFRFLQLLCENDNHQLKCYVYSQLNSDGVIKHTSVNFIEHAANTLSYLV